MDAELVALVAERMLAFKRDRSYHASYSEPWGPVQPVIDKYGERDPRVDKIIVEAFALSREIEDAG